MCLFFGDVRYLNLDRDIALLREGCLEILSCHQRCFAILIIDALDGFEVVVEYECFVLGEFVAFALT